MAKPPARQRPSVTVEMRDEELPVPSGFVTPVPAAPPGEILPPLVVTRPDPPMRYEARLEVVEAFHYRGNVREAPAWVDRNWVGWADHDDLRDIPPGPCLRVPVPGQASTVVCRVGDYVCRVNVRVTEDLQEEKIEVWANEAFVRLFLPVHEKPFRPFDPGASALADAPAEEAPAAKPGGETTSSPPPTPSASPSSDAA